MLLDSPETVPLEYKLKTSFQALLVELRFFRSKLTRYARVVGRASAVAAAESGIIVAGCIIE